MNKGTQIKNCNGFNYIKERPISVKTEKGLWYAFATWEEFLKTYPKRADSLPCIIQYKGHNVSHQFNCRMEIKIDKLCNIEDLTDEIDFIERIE